MVTIPPKNGDLGHCFTHIEEILEMQLVLPNSTFLGIWATQKSRPEIEKNTLVWIIWNDLTSQCHWNDDSDWRNFQKIAKQIRLLQVSQGSPSCFPIIGPYNLKAWLAHIVVAHIVVCSQKHAFCLFVENWDEFQLFCRVLSANQGAFNFLTLGFFKGPTNKSDKSHTTALCLNMWPGYLAESKGTHPIITHHTLRSWCEPHEIAPPRPKMTGARGPNQAVVAWCCGIGVFNGADSQGQSVNFAESTWFSVSNSSLMYPNPKMLEWCLVLFLGGYLIL